MKKLMSVVAVLMLCVSGCGTFPAILDKSHKTIKAAGQKLVEPNLAPACLARAKKCAADKVAKEQCVALTECRGWKKSYAVAKSSIDIGLAGMNRVYSEMCTAGLIEECD